VFNDHESAEIVVRESLRLREEVRARQ